MYNSILMRKYNIIQQNKCTYIKYHQIYIIIFTNMNKTGKINIRTSSLHLKLKINL